MRPTGFVYVWFHKDTGRYYIGSHRGSPDDGYIGSGKHFRLAIKKYGIDAFTRTIDYIGPDYRREEGELIKFFDALNCPLSFNLSHIDSHYTAHSTETKAKLREARAKQVITPEQREKIAHGNRGKTISEEQRRQISDAHTGRVHTAQARKNMSEGRKGMKLSEAHKLKITEGQIRRRAREAAQKQAATS